MLTVDKKFLEDYHEKEWERLKEFYDDVMTEGPEKAKPYPYDDRFCNLKQPLVRADHTTIQTDNEKIWSQIPFSGSLILSLHTCSEQNFARMQGFDISDIPKLIDLSKETGKVQFTLRAFAPEYENLEHLNDIFTELKPPVTPFFPTESIVDPKQHKLWVEEFFELAKVKYRYGLAKTIIDADESAGFFSRSMTESADVYARLKTLGMDEEVEKLSNLLIDDPRTAYIMIEKYFVLLTPKFDGLKATSNVSFSHMKRVSISPDLKSSKITFPVDIGKNIMKKLIQHPTSYHGCINVIENYQQNDLYKLLKSLDHSAKSENPDLFKKTTKELDQVLDNIWNDAKKIDTTKEEIRGGISVALGLIGGFATTVLSGYEGILAGIGFNIADRRLEMNNISVSEKVAKMLKSNSLVNIYDFQKKYFHTDRPKLVL